MEGEDGLDADSDEDKPPTLPPTTDKNVQQGSFSVNKLDAGKNLCPSIIADSLSLYPSFPSFLSSVIQTRALYQIAETVNVYKDANAVLFLMDPRKKWTFDYVEREMPNVPPHTFVLILVRAIPPFSEQMLSMWSTTRDE